VLISVFEDPDAISRRHRHSHPDGYLLHVEVVLPMSSASST